MDYKSRVAVYLRKSRSDNPDESVDATLERHLRILTEYALNYDITVIKVYKEVVSGDGLFTRPQMIALLSDIEQGLYTAVLCVDIDRLGRSSTKDSGIILETLRESGCRIITPDKVYDLDDDVDEMTVEMKSFFARQELKSITRRLKRGELETIKAGGHTNEPPYGYRRKWIGKTPSLEPDENAKNVKLIYDLYEQGYGSLTISYKLRELGISAPNGGPFQRSSVTMILSNPTYKGEIVWNRKKRIKKKRPEDKFKEIDNPPELWLRVKGLHEPIITEEQWDKVEQIRKQNTHPPAYKGIVKNYYSGLVYCANCGCAIQRTTNKGARLLCVNKGCTSSVSMDDFDRRIQMNLKDMLQHLKLERESYKDPELDSLKASIAAAEKNLKTTASQRSKLYDLLEQNVYDVNTFFQRQSALKQKEEKLENEIKSLTEKLSDKQNIRIDDIIPTIEQLLDEWYDLEPLKLNSILKTIIKKITYRRDTTSRTDGVQFETTIEWRF